MQEKPYHISRLLAAHSSDVKCVTSPDSSTILSASRDLTVGVWGGKEGGEWKLDRILEGHEGYVNCVEFIPGDDGFEDMIASAGISTHILLHPLHPSYPSSTPLTALSGHHANVCALSYSRKRRRLISASWDCAARVWARRPQQEGEKEGGAGVWECEKVLARHGHAVWGVAIVEDGPREGCYLTGAADRLIKLWDPTGTLINTFPHLPDSVRSLAVFPGGETFAAALNDMTVRILDLEGKQLQVLKGHEDYVYHVSISSSGLLLSCGEDHTARLWQNSELQQTLPHPCQTVWCASFIAGEAEDVVTAASDGVIRVWSRDGGKVLGGEELEAYERKVEDALVNYRAVKAKSAAASSSSTEFQQGTEEIHVLDIDLEDDSPPIPLRFTNSSDPHETAVEFGKEHGLSENYVRQIEEFLRATLGG